MEKSGDLLSGLLETYANQRVLITGHNGFKGAWLSAWLAKAGAQVTGYSLDSPTEPALYSMLDLPSVDSIRADVLDADRLQQVIHDCKPDFVFHLAAQSLVRQSYADPVETFRVNAIGTVNVLHALRVANRPCVAVMVTTDKCYENREWVYGYRENDPLGGFDPYSSSKAMAELATASYRQSFLSDGTIRVASARAGNVIGGGDYALDRIVPDCVRAIESGSAHCSPKSARPSSVATCARTTARISKTRIGHEKRGKSW